MFLKSLGLQNFRAFEELQLSFHPRMTLVVGSNGAGKSTILEAAAIAAGTVLCGLDGVAKLNIQRGTAHYKYFDMGSGVDVQEQYPVVVSATGTIDGKDYSWSRSMGGKDGRTTTGDAKEIIQLSKNYQQRLRSGDTSLILPIIAYYSTGRLWNWRREKKVDVFRKNTRTNGYIDCLDETANSRLMLHWFQKMSLIDGQRQEPSPAYAAVRGAMELCFMRLTRTDKVKVEFDPDTVEITVTYQQDGKTVKIPLSELSDGYRCIISLFADIAYRMAQLNPQLNGDILKETAGIVLIDEVDLHLHPAWQQRVLSDLLDIFPKVQFIASTHAPAVINSVRSENLLILGIDGKPLSPGSEVYGKDVNSVLSEIMGAETRPLEVVELFKKCYSALDEKRLDEAEQILERIDQLRGYHDPEVAECRTKLSLEHFFGRDDDTDQ